MKSFAKVLILGGACLLGSGMVCAQAPPGPMPPPPRDSTTADPPPPPTKVVAAPPRKNILGAWKFNKDESDDPRDKLKQSRDDSNRGAGNGGPRMGGPWPGGGGPMGGGGYGGHRNPQSSEEADRLGDLVNPARELMLVRRDPNDPEVDLTDDRQRRRIFYTDGRALKKQQDSSYEEIAAHWDGDKLITDEKAPHNGKLSRTYEVSSDGKQLLETVHVTDSKGNHPMTVQYVYDAVDPSSLSTSRY
jgi:hypothetical protein